VDIDQEREIRDAAMAWLSERERRGQMTVAYAELAGFQHGGARVPLIDRQRGIRKPAGFHAALSIRTTYTPPGQPRPYDDEETADGQLRYKYRGDDPKHHENEAIRAAFELELPLIWFVGVARAVYHARYPVWVRGDNPEQLEFRLQLPP
jgi:putative restriction endonuclease